MNVAAQLLMKNMYRTGVLRAGCAVLRHEGFDEEIVREMQWESPRIRSILMQNSECGLRCFAHHCAHLCTAGGKRRSNPDEHSEDGSQGTSKRRKVG